LLQSEVQTRFLRQFSSLYPQLTFRGMRRLTSPEWGPYRFVLRVALGRRGGEANLLCLAVGDGYPQAIARAIEQLSRGPQDVEEAGGVPVIVAPYLTEEARVVCREAGVGYFDLAGNAGLDTPHIFIEIGGKPNPEPRKKEVQTLYEGRAERVVRTLLMDPERRWNMRDLASSAQVSLGLASMVTTSLANDGLVDKSHSGMALVKPATLLDQWAETYTLRRSPFRIYRATASVPDLEVRLLDQGERTREHAALTLWSAARHLLGGFYWDGEPDVLLRPLRLNETSGQSQVFIFRPYDTSILWARSLAAQRPPIVHPLQLYLDLTSGDEEELQLAERVRQRFLF
jgi:hypothetical protein